MALTKAPYKGTRDFFPEEKRVQNYLFGMMNRVALSFGYEPYDGPLLEEVDLYKAKSGEELINEQIYSFVDRGERFVAIRPEMTPTLARMVAQKYREVPLPIRWFAIPNLMRYEKPQRGRLREHWQFNCDIFGAPELLGEIEIIQVAIRLLKSFGADHTQFNIQLNDRNIIDYVFSQLMSLSKEQSYRLYKILDKYKKVPLEAFSTMVNELGISEEARTVLNEYLHLNSLNALSEFLSKHKNEALQSKVVKLDQTFLELDLTKYIVYDPTIVRGLDYYTGIVFEIFDLHPDNKRAICGGGAYGGLMQIFGEAPLPGVGFGLGDVTLKDFLTSHKLLPNFSLPENDVYLSFTEDQLLSHALATAGQLRDAGLKVICGLEAQKSKKAFTTAEKRGAKITCFIEMSDGLVQVKLKNLQSKQEYICPPNDLSSAIKFIYS